jgi:hypothetical protein
MPINRHLRAGLPLLFTTVAVACGGKKVTRPESVSARVIADVQLDEYPTNVVAVAAYLPPSTTFTPSDFRLAYQHGDQRASAICCISMKIGTRALDVRDMQRVGEFSTERRTTLVELAFLVDPAATEATLMYKDSASGPPMTISR